MRNRALKFGDFPISSRDVADVEVKHWVVAQEGYERWLWLSSEDMFIKPCASRFAFRIPENTVLVAGEREVGLAAE